MKFKLFYNSLLSSIRSHNKSFITTQKIKKIGKYVLYYKSLYSLTYNHIFLLVH